MALDLGIPVLPVTVSGTSRLLPKGSMNLMPGTVAMVIHEPIPVTDYSEKNLKKLRVLSRPVIMSGLVTVWVDRLESCSPPV